MTRNLSVLRHVETIRLDSRRLDDLYRHLGRSRADDLLCAGMETLVRCLSQIERDQNAVQPDLLVQTAAELESTAEQIGLPLLRRVARNLQDAATCGDTVAIMAVCARLSRVGHQSLSAFWNSDGRAG
ncbi:hypothetical protein [Pseudoruegeria sp. SK021]|uniref:hypothetical protein n=1 Tax=Pseudoruegeria sp. SK021 TaxID=1933035 RepID=UPI00111C784D|nr:hypothetical protein [Pseudoruegeria sp. SK021]